ncbi:siderophore-interacting protein [Clostridium sp.]|uniref:siderophore-interacting protein n=1 Tax=Clostridium sp. TaxID=1506 RepID=UPI003217FF32
MNKELFRKTEGALYNYKTLIAEVENLKIAIAEEKKEYKGCSAITYEEKTAPTNKFNSTVENEVITKDKQLSRLNEELEIKQLSIQRIENALEPIVGREKEIVELKYFKKLKTWEMVGERVNLSGDYCRNLGKDIIERVSKILFIEKCI